MSLPLCLSKIGKNLPLVLAASLLAACQTTGDPAFESQLIAAGIFETGLSPQMPKEADCPKITVGFASRYTYLGRLREMQRHGYIHTGTDWAMPQGTPVVAIADGRVFRRIEDRGRALGNHIVLKHANVYSEYGHLSSLAVDQGEDVKMGQVIGAVGASGGRATFVHLHMNVTGDEKTRIKELKRNFKYRYDFLQFLSGDMTPIDPLQKRRQQVKVAYIDQTGKVQPPGAKVIWPFICRRKAN
ncbi:MAG: M23 family metallopeptidase [Rhodospirillales bacterium]|nr:M23 family metallopeptidase [Rhodospirillales bacterium]